MTSITGEAVRAFRLTRHALVERAPADRLVDIVRAVGGVHAQLASSAEMALAARLDGLPRDAVRKALDDERTLAKTWMPRGTLHLIAADDVPLYSAVLRDRWDDPGGAWLRGHGVERDQLAAIIAAVARALDGTPRTREELADRVAAVAGPDARARVMSGWGEYLKPSAHRGELCFGPPRGRSVTFVRPDRWLGSWREIDSAEARREIVRRYLCAYGPATADGFARWIGKTPARGKRMLAEVDEVADVDVDGARMAALASDTEELATASAQTVRLLPAFDPYVVGSRPRHLLVDPDHEARVFRPQGWFSPVVLVDGRAVGTWRHDVRRRDVDVHIEAFERLSRRIRTELGAEADRLGAFLGKPARLEL